MKIIVSRITGIEEVNFDMRKVNDNDADIIIKTIERLCKENAIFVGLDGTLIVSIKENNSVRELLTTVIVENLVARGRGLTQDEFDKMYLELKIA